MFSACQAFVVGFHFMGFSLKGELFFQHQTCIFYMHFNQKTNKQETPIWLIKKGEKEILRVKVDELRDTTPSLLTGETQHLLLTCNFCCYLLNVDLYVLLFIYEILIFLNKMAKRGTEKLSPLKVVLVVVLLHSWQNELCIFSFRY